MAEPGSIEELRGALALAPAARVVEATPLEFRERRRDGGLVVRDGKAAVALLTTPDPATWVATALDAEGAWRMTPVGRRHPPELAAFAGDDQVASFRNNRVRPRGTIELAGGGRHALKAPLPWRGGWQLRAPDGSLLAALYSRLREGVALTLEWWGAPAERSSLIALFAAYVVLVQVQEFAGFGGSSASGPPGL